MKAFFEGVLITFVYLLFICALLFPAALSTISGCSGWMLLYFIIIPCLGGWVNCNYHLTSHLSNCRKRLL
jgi:hypothetical protein